MTITKTIRRKQAPKAVRSLKKIAGRPSANPIIKEGEFKRIPVTQLDTSPLNYRQYFSKPELEELAADIAQHGIISNLIVRPLPSGHYEIVAGERRFRAATMIQLKEIPATVVSLTDAEVKEIQLSENGQREDPHPMQEAIRIGELLEVHKTLEELAARIGKSKAFIYNRLKLLTLIDPIREIFLANKCTATQAIDIATVSPESQAEFFAEYCANWKDEHFRMPITSHSLDQFKYDLTDAPFNIRDKKLVPEAGACTGCPFNTATIKTLFPEMATESVCTKKECYRSKCQADASLKTRKMFAEFRPQALLYYHDPESLKSLIRLIPEAATLPVYHYRQVQVVEKPEPPDREDYTNEQEEDDDDDERQTDEESFAGAMQEYRDDLQEYNDLLAGGKLMTGLLVSESRMQIVSFNPEERKNNESEPAPVKAADFQTAVKAGTVSIALLQGEIDRINSRETRSAELDREKVQLQVYEKFGANLNTMIQEPTAADLVAVRLILFQSLNYSAKNKVMEFLSIEFEKYHGSDSADLYRQLENLNPAQFTYLIRMAVASNCDSKNPKSESGYVLYKIAEQAGLDVAIIEKEQKEKTYTRQTKQQQRISALQKQIEKMKIRETVGEHHAENEKQEDL